MKFIEDTNPEPLSFSPPALPGIGRRFTSQLDGMAHALESWIRPLARNLEAISAVVAGVMSIPIFLDVICRLVLNRSIPGIIEIEEFMMVMIVFLALGFLQSEKEHVAIDLIVKRFPLWIQHLVDFFNYTVCFCLFAIMSWQCVRQIVKKKAEVSFSLGIPISMFIGVAAFGIMLLSIVLLIDIIKTVSTVIKDKRSAWLIVPLGTAAFFAASPFLIKASASGRPDGFTLGLVGMGVMFALLLVKMPIGMAMTVTGFWGMLILSRRLIAPLTLLGIAPYYTSASFILAVVPLFILMGELAFHSGISQDLFDTAYKWLGRLPGGLAMAAVAGCAGFSAVCGDSMSTAVTMGAVSLPEMEKKRYQGELATGSLAAGGTLGILIPPSVGFIFYAIVTEESVGKLFVAGILPGLMLAVLFMFCIFFLASRHPELAPRGEKTSMAVKLIALKGVIPMLLLFVLIIGGILGGIFSPTEGGGIGAVGAFGYALLRRRITRDNLMDAIRETARLTTKLLLILIGVGILGNFLAATRLPFTLSDMVTGLPCGRYVIFTAVLFLFIVLGCLMNVIPMILLTLPAIYPTILSLGFDPIWFGVVTVIVMEMGQITPPIGVNVFALSSVAENVPLEIIFKGVLPFFICMLVCVVLLVVFPPIATFLPSVLF